MKKSQHRWVVGISLLSLLLSILALSVVWSSNDDNLLPDFSAIAVGTLGTLVTLLVAWQIYNALQVEERLSEAEERRNEMINQLKREFDERLLQTRGEFEGKGQELLKKANDIALAMQNMRITPPESVMSIAKFNTPQKLARELSQIGIGELNEWRNSVAGVNWDDYVAITPYYMFGDQDYTKIQSNIALYLVGKEFYAETLDIVLNIGYQQSHDMAISIFVDTIHKTNQLLDLRFDFDWLEQHTKIKHNSLKEESNLSTDLCDLTFNYENFGRIETYKLTIRAKRVGAIK